MQKGSIQKLDLSTWRNFLDLAKPFFVSEKRGVAFGLVFLLIVLSLTVTRVNIWMSEIIGRYMDAFTEKNVEEFYTFISWFAVAVLCASPVSVFYRYTEEKFGLAWRRWLTNNFLARYFSNRSYYRINLEKTLDNPDQRIVDEIKIFTGTSISFLLILFNAVVNLVAWSIVLLKVSATLSIASFIYAFLGSLVTMIIGRRLVALNFAQVKKEADFRYSLVKVRDNAESIALYRGEDREGFLIGKRLRDVLKNFNILIGWYRNLGFFTKTYDYFKPIIPVLIAAPLYFAEEIKFGTVTQATIAFTWVLDALSLIISQFERLSAFASTIARLSSLSEEIDKGARFCVWPRENETWITIGISDNLAAKNLTVMTPNRQRVLIKDLSFELAAGQRLIVTGASGVGKTSLFRAIAALWTDGQGTIMRPELNQLVFLPQTPYMVAGSFRQQLRYIERQKELSDERLMEVIELVGLSETVRRLGGLNAEYDWANVLSLGEQQRVAFARLFLARPALSLLDESTTALDLEAENEMYKLLQSSGKSFVSIGHRQSLMQYHDYHLELTGGGLWRYLPVATG